MATIPDSVASEPAAVAAEATGDEVQVAQAQAPEAADEAGSAPPAAAPGQFEVDESLIDRALERTLVQEGVLLLPFGQAEIEPSFQYLR